MVEASFLKSKILTLLFVGLVLLVTTGVVLNWPTKRTPSKYLVPENYRGWICIEFGAKGAAALLLTNGSYVFNIPPNGYLKTSTALTKGWAQDEFYYLTKDKQQRIKSWGGWGEGKMVWPGTISYAKVAFRGKKLPVVASNQGTKVTIFIGHEKQYRWAIDKNYVRVGPLQPPKPPRR